MRTLLLMRHAKSDWSADYGADHDRPLNERGERSARLMGRLLRAEDLIPDLVVSSSATRARHTAELADQAGSWESRIAIEPTLYGASVESVIDVVRSAPDVSRLMVVGHQPTWSGVVAHLTDTTADMKTGTVAVMSSEIGAWSQIGPGSCSLTSIYVPRAYFGSGFDR